tara:strand:- start:109 stop:303 length:195 start_codon:yes stop_codon:yes gene_type:complete
MHFHSWRRGLKTGMYYLRTQPAADAIKFTLGAKQGAGAEPGAEQSASESCAFGSGGSDCEACGS